MKRSLSNVCVILGDITFSEIDISLTLANTHEGLGKTPLSLNTDLEDNCVPKSIHVSYKIQNQLDSVSNSASRIHKFD